MENLPPFQLPLFVYPHFRIVISSRFHLVKMLKGAKFGECSGLPDRPKKDDLVSDL